MDRGTLFANINNWYARTDLVDEDSILHVAQAMIDRDVRVRAMITESTLAAENNRISLPDDFLHLLDINWEDEDPLSSRTKWINAPIKSNTAHRRYGRTYYYGGEVPQYYTILGENIVLAPDVTDGDRATLNYFALLSRLNDTEDTNWVLENAYDVYHFGCLHAMAHLLGDTGRAADFMLQYKSAADLLNQSDHRARRTSQLRNYIPDRIVV